MGEKQLDMGAKASKKRGLSKEDLDYIDSTFDLIDINKDGTISLKELRSCK